MRMNYRRFIIVILIILVLFPVVFAEDPIKGTTVLPTQLPTVNPTPIPTFEMSEKTAFVTQWQGTTTLSQAIAIIPDQKEAVVREAFETTFNAKTYPYEVKPLETKITDVTIDKFRCDEKTNVCGYWITATRGGREVAVNNPIWLFNPPYATLVSETYDNKADVSIVVIKEDPFGSVENILQEYADRQPLGRATVGTKA